jgi:hypothetical protein
MPKQDEQVLSLTDQQMFVTSRDIQNQLKRKGAKISERTVRCQQNEAGAKFSPPMSSNESLEMGQSTHGHQLGPSDLFRRDHHSSESSQTPGIEYARKKEGDPNDQASDQSQRLAMLFE